MLGDFGKGVESGVAEAGDAAEEDGGVGEADLEGAGGFAAAGEDAGLAVGLGGDDGLLGLAS